MARLVVPGYPHHITQRGNRKQQTFFAVEDYRLYLRLLERRSDRCNVEIWAWCLMPNHVHVVAVPETTDGLARLFGRVHQAYSRAVNERHGWTGHLWQERFHSFVMDEDHLLAAVRYVELNPVRARLCEQPADWPWSSVHAHLKGRSEGLTEVEPMLERIGNWSSYLLDQAPDRFEERFQTHDTTGRPAGSDAFIEKLEMLTGRQLRKQRVGRKPSR